MSTESVIVAVDESGPGGDKSVEVTARHRVDGGIDILSVRELPQDDGISKKRRHNCERASNGTDWCICAACDGRIHNPGCTTKRNKHRDCCPERHKMLHDQGQTTWNGGTMPMYVEGQTW